MNAYTAGLLLDMKYTWTNKKQENLDTHALMKHLHVYKV